MPGSRSALIDAPPAPIGLGGLGARPSPEAIVERPLAGRIPKRGNVRGPVLVKAGSATKAGSRGTAGGQGSFFRACILLLLHEQPAHGYDLLERLAPFGFDSGDSGWMYRTLRSYERERLLESTWQISASGPPRRVYSITAAGRDVLDAWASSLRASQRGVDDFLSRHGRAVGQRPTSG